MGEIMKKASALVVFLLATTTLQAQQLRTLKDVVYGKIGDRELTLDAYLWDWATLAPAVIYIHGGGWRNGDKTRLPDFLQEALFKSGISLISISYRLSGEAVHPAQVSDVTRAVQFVKHNAPQWHIHKDRIAVMGSSAGAHLSLWIGLHPDLARPHSADAVERESTRVAAIVNYYGPTNFHLIKEMEHSHPAYRTVFGFEPGTPAAQDRRRTADDVLAHHLRLAPTTRRFSPTTAKQTKRSPSCTPNSSSPSWKKTASPPRTTWWKRQVTDGETPTPTAPISRPPQSSSSRTT